MVPLARDIPIHSEIEFPFWFTVNRNSRSDASEKNGTHVVSSWNQIEEWLKKFNLLRHAVESSSWRSSVR